MKQILNSEDRKFKTFVESKKFDLFIMFVICLNSVVLGMMTSSYLETNFGGVLFLADRLCLAIFLVEMALKLYVYREDFFKSKWNIFDFLIVGISSFSFASSFIIFRAFRLFRLLKYINRFSKLKRIISVFQSLFPNFVAFMLVFGLFLYVFAIISVNLFSERFLEFAGLPEAIFTLLQLFTLDDWSSVARPVMAVFPHSWIFFVSYLLISILLLLSFIMSLIDEVVKKEVTASSKQPKESKVNAAVSKILKKVSKKS